MLFPPRSRVLAVEIATAIRVAEAMFDRGTATVARPDDARAWIASRTCKPEYR